VLGRVGYGLGWGKDTADGVEADVATEPGCCLELGPGADSALSSEGDGGGTGAGATTGGAESGGGRVLEGVGRARLEVLGGDVSIGIYRTVSVAVRRGFPFWST
jgi:hypothetical protein